jgi:hypothetical protein
MGMSLPLMGAFLSSKRNKTFPRPRKCGFAHGDVGVKMG